MKKEIWRDVVGYEGKYMVSDQGRVKSLPRIVDRKKMGKVFQDGRIMKTHPDRKRRIKVRFSNGSGKGYYYSVHRLVALAFVGIPVGERNQVNHIDGNPQNNIVCNLEWVTPKENIAHAFKMGLRVPIKGIEHWMAKLTVADVKKIRRIHLDDPSLTFKETGKIFSISGETVSSIVKRHHWKHVK